MKHLMGLKGIGGNVYNGIRHYVAHGAIFTGMALWRSARLMRWPPDFRGGIFMTVTPYSVGEAYAVGANWLGGANIISGIIIGPVVAEMFTFIAGRNW
ncbi:hypothetical protein KCP74_19640 [Salmonella enterica subsp. enterica]|nr:hypothetical protein KCP74_19640 [Salmonella enterica subsp. enterica]